MGPGFGFWLFLLAGYVKHHMRLAALFLLAADQERDVHDLLSLPCIL